MDAATILTTCEAYFKLPAGGVLAGMETRRAQSARRYAAWFINNTRSGGLPTYGEIGAVLGIQQPAVTKNIIAIHEAILDKNDAVLVNLSAIQALLTAQAQKEEGISHE